MTDAFVPIDKLIPSLKARLTEGFEKQVPFATARALTWTARQAEEQIERDLADHFTVRRRERLEKGIRYKRATKVSQQARVGTVDEYMARQEIGGKKMPGDGKKTVAVPVSARPTPSAITPKSKWPGALLKRRGFILATNGGLKVMSRKGRRGRSDLLTMYKLPSRVEVEPRWRFVDTVRRVVQRRWVDNGRRSLDLAIKESKRRGKL